MTPTPSTDCKLSELDLAYEDKSNIFHLSVSVRSPLKWAVNTFDFRSVFSGSNDRNAVENAELIYKYINSVSSYQKVILLSVIGGMYFLDMVDKLSINRLILFDNNINEFAKLTAILNEYLSDSDLDPILTVEEQLTANPSSILPKLSQSNYSLCFGDNPDWQFEGITEPSFPVLLRKNNFPKYAYNPKKNTPISYEKLKSILCEKAFMDIPVLDAEGSLVVVFASNAGSQLPDSYIQSRIKNAPGVIVVRSCNSDNAQALNPHPYWEAVARHCLTGSSHQVWAPEDRYLLKTDVDSTTDSSSVLTDTLEIKADTVLAHILLGKCHSSIKHRMKQVRDLMQRIDSETCRLVIAEFNPGELTDYPHLELFPDQAHVKNFYESVIPKEFQYSKTLFAPGRDSETRNMFLIYNRKQ